MNIITDIVAVAIVLGVIIFLHELGHFVAAKWFGVRVETFSLGFGTRLVGIRRNGTDYCIRALPLGGYVKMAGELPSDFSQQAVVRPGDLASKPRWQRLVIVCAGPAMNVILAIGLLIPVYMRQFPKDTVLDQPAVIAAVAPHSVAARAGLEAGDRIVAADGVADPTWQQVGVQAALAQQRQLPLTVRRGSREFQVTVMPGEDQQQPGFGLGLTPAQPVYVDSVMPNSPAAQAGLQPGDHITALNGERILAPEQLTTALQKARGAPARLTLERHGAVTSTIVHPRWESLDGQHHRWMVGVALRLVKYVRLPLGAAVEQSLRENGKYSTLILDLVGRLVTRHSSLTALQGPVSIAAMAGQMARQPTLVPLIAFTSILSLNLGILNLLPIPVLDGGAILFLLLESMLRHDVSLQVKERIYQAGFAFLVLLMTFVIYNDIVRVVVRGGHG
ncbi:MAG: RIP metalloprotease RseP [Terriglobales bacterium]